MSEYRIVKNTFADGTIMFNIEKQSVVDSKKWNYVTNRITIDQARYSIELLKGQELVNSEVVE